MTIENYFTHVKSIIEQYQYLYSNSDFLTEIFDPINGLIKGEVIFDDKSYLSFLEVKDVEENSKTKYRYHYMDKDKNLIFRYDNAAHHKEISTFPHHKHTPNGVEESNEPNIGDIMKEIEKIISN